MTSAFSRRPVRTVFISDIHMGLRGAQVDALLAFLETIEPDTIYLVGDIVDGWRLRKSWYWPAACNRLVQVLLERLRKGTRVVYIPGNHDEFLRDFAALRFGGIELCQHSEHVALDGTRYLVTHGDQFDLVVRHAGWIAGLGDIAYNMALGVAMTVNRMRRRLGQPHWSLSAWARANVGKAAALVTRFETALCRAARDGGYGGVICGHIHNAADHRRDGVHYLNCGDWVEHCTAIVEWDDGRLELVTWRSTPEPVRRHSPAAEEPIDVALADRY